MPVYSRLILLCIATILLQNVLQAKEALHVYTDKAVITKGKFQQTVYYTSDKSFKTIVDLQCFKFTSDKDSVLVLNKRNYKATIKTGTGKFNLLFKENNDTDSYYSSPYYEILKRTGGVAPGTYKTIVRFKDERTHEEQMFVFHQEVDTIFSANSPVREDINRSIAPKHASFMGVMIKKNLDKVKAYGSGNALANAEKKINKKAKARGLRHVPYERNGKSYIDYYYEDWFAGRYEVNSKNPLETQLKQQEGLAGADNASAMTQNDLAPHPAVFTQFKTFKQQKDDNKEMKGEIAVSGNTASRQDLNSGINNNYYEVRGQVEIPVMGLPVILEGLYTSQDANRQVKTSYFRVHYDVNQVKDGMKQFISSYNQKFAETKSKSTGMTQIYQKAIGNLEGQKAAIERSVQAQTNTKQFVPETKSTSSLIDTSGLTKGAVQSADSGNTVANSSKEVTDKENAAKKDEQELENKRKEIEALDKRINRYKTLLAQNNNNNYFDSAMAYEKLGHLNTKDDGSYKQLTKRGENLLPDGHAKKFITGLTSFDAGMFPKYASKYTMSGQMMKGIDAGYDLGICETGFTIGKTEYVGRDGTPDKYTCYSGRAIFKLPANQKAGIVYYGYSPDKTAYAGDGFFKNINVATPTFFHPVHIISGNYSGMLSKYVTVDAESAASFKKVQPTEGNPNPSQGDNMAWHFNTEGNIPNTPISLQGSYDKTGKQFENNTLPVSQSGTEQYKVSGKTDFFHSFLAVGVEFDRITQANFSVKATSTKWGFDIKTHSKRFPNVSLSYKPFTTFRSYADTLNIPQRPMLGSVWTSRATYQFKRQDRSWRFSLLYNKCRTIADTVSYGSTLGQLMCMYTEKATSVTLTGGYMAQTGTNTTTVTTAPSNMSFMSATTSYTFDKRYILSGGLDLGRAVFGFCKYGMNAGLALTGKKSPFTTRFNFRCSTYQLNQGEQWKQLVSGNMEVLYKFKTKAIKRNKY